MKNSVIVLNNLTKYYGKTRGIENVSFTVEEGEIFGFIGPNGAGKSTTIRTLLSLIHPTSGSATIFGKDISNRVEILQNVGYLPSEVFYYDNMKVRDLLRYSASFYKMIRTPEECEKRINQLCELLELDLNRKIEDLSYGNRKKVGIVQSMLHSPNLLILDEPTSGLDPLMKSRFFDLLRKERDLGTTILFSSHILSEVQSLCDRVAIIREGSIVKVDKISNLRESNYKRVNISTEGMIPIGYFEDSEITVLEINGNTASFLYSGNINRLLQKLVGLPLANLSIVEPDLEELFIHYYN
jgi:ABC-2 type transport system ATP-binding protein